MTLGQDLRARPASTTREAALDAGADAIGLNFVPGIAAPRSSSPTARAIARARAGPRRARRRVPRRADAPRWSAIAAEVRSTWSSCTATESPEYAAALLVPGAEGAGRRRRAPKREAARYPGARAPARLIRQGGGSGHALGLRARARARSRAADGSGSPAGSTPENVAAGDPRGVAVRCRRGVGRRVGAGPEGSARSSRAFVAAVRARREARDADPTRRGHFGRFGGRYVPETLVPALDELAAAWDGAARRRRASGASSPTCAATTPAGRRRSTSPRARARSSACAVYLKREDLAHTGAHKINNALGQALLARRMGKRRIIAETGAGQHGVATATACARFGLECEVYMGAEDVRAAGAQRVPHGAARRDGARRSTSGSRTLKDAINEAMRDWVTNVRSTYYLIGSVAGPHPYPTLVRDFQARDRRRGARADPGGGGPAARRAGRLRRRRHQRDRAVPAVLRRHRRCA